MERDGVDSVPAGFQLVGLGSEDEGGFPLAPWYILAQHE